MARRRGADRRIEEAAGPEGERVARAGPRRMPFVGSRPSGGPRLEWGLPELFVGAVALATYLNALGGDFVSDARRLILNNPAFLDSREWLAWFTRDYYWGAPVTDVSLYRPLAILSFLLHVRTTGVSPFPFLLGNALLHAAASVLVLRLGTRLLGWTPAVVGALVFAVHPLHTEAVAWIAGRAELLAALFSLAACLGFLRATDPGEPRRGWFVAGTVVAYLAALFSKEHVVLLPAWFAVVWWLDRPARSGRCAAWVAVGSVAALAVFLLLRDHALSREPPEVPTTGLYNPAAVVSAPLRWLTAAAVVFRYALLFVWPATLSNHYSYAQIRASTGIGAQEAAGILVILGVLAGIWWATRRAPGAAAALALTLLTFVLVSNFPFAIGTVMAERLTYLPSVGVCLTAGWLLARLAGAEAIGGGRVLGRPAEVEDVEAQPRGILALGRHRRPWVVAGVVVGMVVALGARTAIRNQDWQDPYTIARAAVRDSPESASARLALASQERMRGNHERAIELLQDALRIYPDYPGALLWLGDTHLDRGEYQAAAEQYRKALALVPRSALLRYKLGTALARLGLPAEAERELREAVRHQPRLAGAWRALGELFLDRGRPAEALQHFRVAERLRPQDPAVLYGLARAAAATGDREDAAAYARRAAGAGARIPEEFWRSLGSVPGPGPS